MGRTSVRGLTGFRFDDSVLRHVKDDAREFSVQPCLLASTRRVSPRRDLSRTTSTRRHTSSLSLSRSSLGRSLPPSRLFPRALDAPVESAESFSRSSSSLPAIFSLSIAIFTRSTHKDSARPPSTSRSPSSASVDCCCCPISRGRFVGRSSESNAISASRDAISDRRVSRSVIVGALGTEGERGRWGKGAGCVSSVSFGG